MGLGEEGEGSGTSVTAQVYSRFDFVLAGRGSGTDERRVVLQVVDRKGVRRENKFA
jgi:hypothetical protein